MSKEEIATQLICLYHMAAVKGIATQSHRMAIANAILLLGYKWDTIQE